MIFFWGGGGYINKTLIEPRKVNSDIITVFHNVQCPMFYPTYMLGKSNCFLTPALYLAYRYENTSS